MEKKRGTLIKVLLIYLFFNFAKTESEYFQQCVHLSGTGKLNQLPVYADTVEENATPGTIFGSTSFLISGDKEIIIFFGQSGDGFTDRVWKFDINSGKWKFIKGREKENRFYVIDNSIGYSEENQIGSRYETRGWINGNISSFFGGSYIFFFLKCTGSGMIPNNDESEVLNEIWLFNISNYQYFPLRYNNMSETSEFSTNFNEIGVFHPENIPSARVAHEIVQINDQDQEILLIGGVIEKQKIADWWIYSSILNQWKVMGIDTSSSDVDIVFGTTNVYHENNTIGSRKFAKAILINEEEVFLMGGGGPPNHYSEYLNIVQKYNITSNMWKFVSGSKTYDQHGKIDTSSMRGYSNETLPGGRYQFALHLLKNKNEVLVFGGRGYDLSESSYGELNDEFVFNLKTNLWKFTSREITMKKDRNSNLPSSFDASYEDNIREEVLMGGMRLFVNHYLEKENAMIICNGKGYTESSSTEKYLDSCWRIYYGNICNYIEEESTGVCSGVGKCQGRDDCSCNENYFGNNCQITQCFDILSNETEACFGKGDCLGPNQCSCFDTSIFVKDDCSVNDELITYFVILFISGLILFLVIVILFVMIFIFCSLCMMKLGQKAKKLDEIEDLDIVLEEQKFNRNSSVAHFKINKKLFEIDSNDIQIEKKIGNGGSSATVYLASWNHQKVAYKVFVVQDFLEDDKFKEFEKEVEILASINFPYILNFFGATMNTTRLGFVMEYADNGDLEFFLQEYKNLTGNSYPMKQKLRMLYEISSALSFLFNKNIIHRDLKPQNILVTSKETTKLMDFGLSKILDQSESKTKTKRVGTSFYMAPEVNSGKYSFSCDVYSFAILMFVVLSENYKPWGKNDFFMYKKIASDPNLRPDINELQKKGISKEILSLITTNWQHDSSKRMNIQKISEKLNEISKDYQTKELEIGLNENSSEMEKLKIIKEQKEKIVKLENKVKDLEKEIKNYKELNRNRK